MLNRLKALKKKWLLLGIIFLSVLLRLISINQSFWLDEATTANVTRNFNLFEIITKFSPGDFHPPLYYLLSKVWSIPFGVSEFSLRILSVIVGSLTVFFLYKIAKKYKGENFGLISALLLATSPLHIYYSQEARMYVMETFFVVVSIYLYQSLLKKEKVTNWILFSLSLVLIGFTDYLPLLILPVFFIHSVFIKKNFKWFKKLSISLLPLFIIFIFWLPIFTKQLSGGLSVFSDSPIWWRVLGRFSFKELFLIPLKFVIGRISFFNKILYLFVLLPYIFLFGLLFLKQKKQLKTLSFPLLWFFVPLLLTVALSFRISVLSYFRLIFILPAFYFFLSFSIESLKKPIKNIVTVAIILFNLAFSCIYFFNPRFHREDWRGLVSFIENTSLNNEAVTLFVRDSQMEAYNYYSTDQIKAIAPDQFEPGSKTVWLMRYVQDIFDPQDIVRIELEKSGYQKKADYDFNGVVVSRYDL